MCSGAGTSTPTTCAGRSARRGCSSRSFLRRPRYDRAHRSATVRLRAPACACALRDDRESPARVTSVRMDTQWGTTPNSIGAVGSGEAPAPGQDINVLGGDYVFPSYVRRGPAGRYYVTLPPRSHVFMAPSAARGELRTGAFHASARRGQQLLIPAAAKLWGGQYSSVGKFPAGFNGQRSYGGEWNVWALPTEEQMANAGCDEPCIDGPLASIGEHNVLDGLGNDPDSSVWNPEAGDQPAGTGNNCCGGSALGEAGGFEEPSHAWLSA